MFHCYCQRDDFKTVAKHTLLIALRLVVTIYVSRVCVVDETGFVYVILLTVDGFVGHVIIFTCVVN